MTNRDKNICRVWDETNDLHPAKSDEWRTAMTCEIYEQTYRDTIDVTDIMDALEAREK